MSGSDPSEYQTWVNNLVESTPNTIVLSSQEQDWAGLDVALLRYTQKQVAAPAFANHLIVVHLNGIPHFVSERDGQIYETEVTQGDVSILPAGGSSEWQWHKRGRCDSLHLALETTFIRNVAAEIGYSNPEQIEILNHFIVHDPQIQHLGLVLKAELESGGLSGHLFGESIATALAIRLVTQYSASGQPFEWKFEQDGTVRSLEVQGNLFTNNPDVLLEATLAGMGVYQTAHFAVADYLESGQLQSVLTNYETTGSSVWLVYPQNRYLSAKVRVFAEFIVELTSQLRG